MMDNAKSGGFLSHLLNSGIMRIPEGVWGWGWWWRGGLSAVVPTSI